jgi:DNA-binding response OmpR family regulator
LPVAENMRELRNSILCIDDDQEISALIAEELIERGFQVRLARNGREGLSSILSEPPDLVLCDVSMPIMSGFELQEQLTTIRPDLRPLPFVFLTALNDLDSEISGRQLEAGDYLTKPVDFDALATIITARLSRLSQETTVATTDNRRPLRSRPC